MNRCRAGAPRDATCSVLVAMAFALAAAPAAKALPAPKPPSDAALKELGVRVVWPAKDRVTTVTPGERIRVPVRRAGASTPRVTLVRVDARGRPLRAVMGDSGRRGVLRVTVPSRAGARYALRLQVGDALFWSWLETAPDPEPVPEPTPAPVLEPPPAEPPAAVEPAPPPAPPPAQPAPGPGAPPVYSHPGLPCPASGGYAAATHTTSATSGRAGDVIRLTITNTGNVCLSDRLDSHWERQTPGGGWEQVAKPPTDPPEAVPGWAGDRKIAMMGETWTVEMPVWSTLEPGRHRLVKTLGSPAGPWVITVEFEVLPD
jgi:hypothetical protein